VTLQNRRLRTTVICPLTSRGTFSEINILLLASLYAEQVGADFFVDDRRWAPGGREGYSRFFDVPFPRWSKPSPHYAAFRHHFVSTICRAAYNWVSGERVLSAARVFDEMTSYSFWLTALNVEDETDVDAELFRRKKAALEQFYRFNAVTRRQIEELCVANRLPPTYCAVHVRRGDKITSGEMTNVPLERYAEAAVAHGCPDVVIFSDDARVVEPFRRQVRSLAGSNCRVVDRTEPGAVGFLDSRFRAAGEGQRVSEVVRVFADMALMIRAKHLVCTMSSNLPRFAALHLGTERCTSLDVAWHPF